MGWISPTLCTWPVPPEPTSSQRSIVSWQRLRRTSAPEISCCSPEDVESMPCRAMLTSPSDAPRLLQYGQLQPEELEWFLRARHRAAPLSPRPAYPDAT